MVRKGSLIGLIGAMVFACCLTIGGIVLMKNRQASLANPYPTAIVEVIPAPTLTPSPFPTATPLVEEETIGSPLASPSGRKIRIGDSVQIYGTQGDGLRLRAKAGLEGEILFLAFEGEIFQVEDGPQEASGYLWWYLVAPYDENVSGWAVENYLKVIESQN